MNEETNVDSSHEASNDVVTVDRIIRRRRTNMFVDAGRVVPHEVIDELCALATWAPNHKRTWPWRFASVTGSARSRLGEVVSDVLAANNEDPAKVTKARTKYERTPNVLVIGSVIGDSIDRTAENRDAVAAAAQNLMLAATARGIATYWGSCPRGAHEAVASFAGFEPDTTIVGIFYVGYEADEVAVPERPPVAVNHIS